MTSLPGQATLMFVAVQRTAVIRRSIAVVLLGAGVACSNGGSDDAVEPAPTSTTSAPVELTITPLAEPEVPEKDAVDSVIGAHSAGDQLLVSTIEMDCSSFDGQSVLLSSPDAREFTVTDDPALAEIWDNPFATGPGRALSVVERFDADGPGQFLVERVDGARWTSTRIPSGSLTDPATGAILDVLALERIDDEVLLVAVSDERLLDAPPEGAPYRLLAWTSDDGLDWRPSSGAALGSLMDLPPYATVLQHDAGVDLFLTVDEPVPGSDDLPTRIERWSSDDGGLTWAEAIDDPFPPPGDGRETHLVDVVATEEGYVAITNIMNSDTVVDVDEPFIEEVVAWTSPDLVQWEHVGTEAFDQLEWASDVAVAEDGTLVVAGQDHDSSLTVLASPDGHAWTAHQPDHPVKVAPDLLLVEHDGRLVAVGSAAVGAPDCRFHLGFPEPSQLATWEIAVG